MNVKVTDRSWPWRRVVPIETQRSFSLTQSKCILCYHLQEIDKARVFWHYLFNKERLGCQELTFHPQAVLFIQIQITALQIFYCAAQWPRRHKQNFHLT